MLLAVLVANILLFITILTAVYYLKTQAKRTVNHYFSEIQAYFTEKNDDGLTVIDVLTRGIAGNCVETLQNTLTAQGMAHNSHLARQMNAIQGDILQDQINNENPILGAILEQMPSVKKRLIKNPSAAQAFMPMISHLLKPGKNPDNGKANNDDWIARLHGST